jgi:phosphoglycolate phosphatase-like HAD superfamily hydrolase
LSRSTSDQRSASSSPRRGVGDSITDIQVSLATGIRSIGFAKTPIRGRELHAAGADAVTESVAILADLVRRSHRA